MQLRCTARLSEAPRKRGMVGLCPNLRAGKVPITPLFPRERLNAGSKDP